MKKNEWQNAQIWESEWWGDCLNTFNEEVKQYTYAHLMGLDEYATNYYGQNGWDFSGKTVLDVGCGPVSILLKSNAKLKVGIDPCSYPDWVSKRYRKAEIKILKQAAEEMNFDYWNDVGLIFDIGLIYNCLQHVKNPEKIVKLMLKYCKLIYVFEWVDEPVSPGHLHTLTANDLDRWLGGEGKVTELNHSPTIGRAYHGIFKGK